ncbi:MAG: hypothetical protein QOD93_3620 [Acetobacteraceae bacterium]|jgi:hypothetical protein|nr:hypothetical protein [Acetobacteraceae bacterium]
MPTSVARRASVRQFTRAGGQKAFREAAGVQFRGALAQFDAGDVLARPW